MKLNPFMYGNPVSPEYFIGRRRGLRRVISRLLGDGQSTAIIGDPRIGKTSFLNYLAHPAKRQELYDGKAERWYFSTLDIHQMLGDNITPALFWEYALTSIKEHIEQAPEDSSTETLLAKHYRICVENHFGNFTLERLFAHLKKMGSRFILFLDEFDALLHHPVLNSAEFYGGLRALSSNSQNALSLVIASQTPLSKLNAYTQELNPTGSAFFNIFYEFTLGPLTKKAMEEILALAEDRFTTKDKQIIRRLAGQHPFLLQATASTVWDCYEEEEVYHTHDLQHYVAERLYRELDFFFSGCWKIWTPEMRKAFTTVAIAHQAALLPKRKFDIADLIKEAHNWEPELAELRERGAIAADPDSPIEYRVAAEIMLTWLADELVKVVRTKQSFDTWLQDKEIEGAFLSNKEKGVFQKAVTGSAKALGKGATAIIEAFGKGLGSGAAGKIM